MSSLQQNWITKGWNRFCLEVRGKREIVWKREAEGRNDPNNVCTCE
jgi:hypothetical protein